MRLTLPLFALLAACSPAKQEQPIQDGDPERVVTSIGEGRDRFCIKRTGDTWHVGIVTYGAGDTNCTLKGRVVEAFEHESVIQADGDKACRFYTESDGDRLRLPQRLPAACDYYCGPGATLAGKTFKNDPNASPAVDFAGDPLC